MAAAPADTDSAVPPFPPFPHWQRNLYVCLFGSFTTGVAMTLLLPFLPLYLEQLGVQGHAALAQWSGLAFAATFLSAGLVAPLWGRMADRYGRKLMLIRASLGMAITMALIGVVANAWQLVALRLLAGLVGGYASGSMVLVATQTPKARTGWALGTLSSGFMAGNLLGPLVGGSLPPLIGIRATFFLAGGVIFIAFLATCLLIRETRPVRVPLADGTPPRGSIWAQIPDRRPVLAMLLTGLLLTLAHMSVEPIITVYIAQLLPSGGQVTWFSGLAMSAGALGNILAAPHLGKLADRVGYHRVIVVCLLAAAALLLPQAFVGNVWQLIVLRFLMGAALAGLLPCIASVIRNSVPAAVAGGVLGYSTSSQYAGQVAGPLLGGLVGGHIGMRAVFLATSALMVAGALVAHRAARLAPVRLAMGVPAARRPAGFVPAIAWAALAPLGAVLVWSGNTIVTKAAAGAIEPSAIAFYRWLLAWLVLTPFLAPAVWQRRAVVRQHLPRLAVLGALGMATYQGLAYEAARSTSAVNMGVIVALMPLMSALLASALAGERVSARRLLGAGVSIAGLVVLTTHAQPLALLSGAVHRGDAWMLLAVASNALYGVLVRRWALPLSTWQQLYVQIIFGLLTLLPFWLAGPASPLTAANIPLVLYAGIPASIAAPFFWMTGIKHWGAARASLFMNLLPVLVALLAWALLDERLYAYHAWGGLLALAGVALALSQAAPPRAS